MDRTLFYRLSLVARRLQQYRFAWALAMLWLVAAACGGLLYLAFRAGLPFPTTAVRYWLVATVAAALVAAVYFYAKRLAVPRVAAHIQQHFPSLRQTLVTAIEQRPDDRGRFSYLQRSVITEALQHDVIHRWPTAVSSGRLLSAWAANIPGLVAFVLAATLLLKLPSRELLGSASIVLPTFEDTKLVIEPGNTEIEKGTNLIVTGTFAGPMPTTVTMRYAVTQSSSAEEVPVNESTMRQSLNDPVFSSFIDNVNEPIEYRVAYDGMESPTFRIEVFEFPALVRADATLKYPSFTGLEPKTIVNTQRITASEQTELTWELNLNKPVASARLIAEEDVLELTSDSVNPTQYRGTVTLVENRTWKLELIDLDGRKNKEAITLRAKVLPNEVTKIQLTSGGDVQVSPIEELTIAAKIRDDFKVTRAGLTYQVSGNEPVDLVTSIEDSGKELTLAEIIDFESLDVQPGDLVAYSVWAEDFDSSGEVRRTSSDIFFAEVRRFEEIFRQGQQPTADQQQSQQQQQQAGQPGQGEQAQELMELQKEIIVAGWNLYRKANGASLPDAILNDVGEVAQSQQDALTQLEEFAAAAEEPEAAELAGKTREAMSRAAEQFEQAKEDQKKSTLFQGVSAAQQAYQYLLQMQPSEFDVVRGQQQPGQQSGQAGSQQRQRQLDQLELNSEENRYQSERLAQEQTDTESELRQVLSRLRELATRQEDINAQLRDLEAALQAAEDEQERRELEERLARLREQQQEMLRDTDELQERMQTQNSENQAATDEAQQQLDEVRENLQNANESMEQGQIGESIASGSKAAEQLNELQEQTRQQAADQFSDTVQEIRDQARTLEETQQQIVEQLANRPTGTLPGLRPEEPQSEVAEQLQQQQERLRELLENMQETVETAEEAEPLLAKDLYETYRQLEQRQAQERLDVTEQLVDRNLIPQANQLSAESLEDFRVLNEGIDAAAESVLGSEVESLRRALDQLDQLTEQLDTEIANATGRSLEEVDPERQGSYSANGQEPGDQNGDRQQQSGQNQAEQQPGTEPQPGQPTGGQQGESQQTTQSGNSQQPGQSQEGQPTGEPQEPNSPQNGQQQDGQPGRGQSGEGQPNGGQPQTGGQPREPEGRPGNTGGRFGGIFTEPQSGSGESAGSEAMPGPLTGDNFVPWTDRLRDVEELVNSPELRWQATEIRQAARDVRSDFNKHAQDPKWSEVEELIATPLRDLRRKVSQELMRQAAEKSQIVPVDRDPVPSEYATSVQSYYENIGGGK